MNWYVLEKNQNFNLPEWARTFGMDEEGAIYIPVAVTQIPEDEVLMRLDAQTYEDILLAQYDDHYYLPTDWLAKEYPQIADLCLMFEHQAKKVKPVNEV